MDPLSPTTTIGLIVGGVVVAIIILIIIICCICRKCEQCCKWSRDKQYSRDIARIEQERTQRQRDNEDARIEREVFRDQIRAKYNLPPGKSNIATIA